MRRWHSPLSSVAILGMLFWLGTAMAPTVGSSTPNSEPVPVVNPANDGAGSNALESSPAPPLLPWPSTYCDGGCPDPPLDPGPDSGGLVPGGAVSSSTTAPPPAAPASRPRVASAPAPPPAPRPVEEWRALVSAYFAPGDVDLALTVIACESGGDPNAQNPQSGAAGLFQHIPRYWAARASAIGLPGASIFDPVANVAAAAYLVYADGGWRHWAASAGCW